MKKRNLILLVLGILIVLIVILGLIFSQSYQVSTMNGDGEVIVCKSCVCYGLLETFESYPAQYNCIGLKFCDHNWKC